MIEWGAKFCWFFTYMPVGSVAVPELVVSAEQRAWVYGQVRALRETKPNYSHPKSYPARPGLSVSGYPWPLSHRLTGRRDAL